MANQANLIPFKKGEDPKRNGNGRKKGSKSINTILKKLLKVNVNMIDPETNEVIKMTRKEAMAFRLVVDAYFENDAKVRMQAAKMILEYTDPILKQIDHTTNGDSLNSPFNNLPLEKQLKILEIMEDDSNKPA